MTKKTKNHNHAVSHEVKKPFGVGIDMFGDEEAPIWVTEFDSNAAREFCNALFRASERDPNRPIIVYINSGGGDASGLLTMLSAIDTIPNKVITAAMGFAMSAGALLLAHGAVRFASPHARIMIHKIQAGAFGAIDDIVNETRFLTTLNDYVMKVLAKDCKKSSSQIEAVLSGSNREVYLGPEEALEMGLIDMIGVPKVSPAPQTEVPCNYVVEVMTTRPTEPVVETKPQKKTKKTVKKKTA